jgi:hypothetical protein
MISAKQIWIGLAEVVPSEGCRLLGEAQGAFVNVLAWAISGRDFYAKVDKAVAGLELKLTDLEDSEPFSRRSAKWEVNEEILRMVDTANEEPSNIVFGAFHKWEKSDA